MESWGHGEPIMLLLYSFSSSLRVSLAPFAPFAVESGGASEHLLR